MIKSERFKQLVLITLGLALLVIELGAYTRLKDAGLGCPDWPGCYGRLIATDEKGWIEMVHRYIAGSLGFLILIIAILSVRWRKKLPRAWMLALALLGLVVFQALLGMWTVTLRLYPIVVMGHLLGGMAILGLLAWFYFLLNAKAIPPFKTTKLLRVSAWLSLVLLIIQLFLGGWVSANYAGVVCADFPMCQGQWWPAMNWSEAFDLTAAGIFTSPGIPLENTPRVTIQVAHRLGALALSLMLYLVGYQLLKKKYKFLRHATWMMLSLITVQIILGICNVWYGLPLAVSLLHNFVAALLLITVIYIVFVVNSSGTTKHAK